MIFLGQVVRIEVYLELPQHDLGVWRLESVIGYDKNDKNVIDYQKLIDNTEYHEIDKQNAMKEIISDVAKRTGELEKIITIMND